MTEESIIPWQLIVNVFTVIGVLVAVFVAFYTMQNDKKNLKLNGLNLVFQKFNNTETRERRRRILATYSKELKKDSKTFTPSTYKNHEKIDLLVNHPELEEDIIIVKSDFEEIAVMAKNGMIDEKAYFDAYWGMMLRCFAALHGNIENTRRKSGLNHFTIYFEKQCDRAVNYWAETASKDEIRFFTKKANS